MGFIHLEHSRNVVMNTYIGIGDIEFPESETIPDGSLYFDIHFRIGHEESLDWQNLSRFERARKLEIEGIEGLIDIAEMCEGSDPRLGIVNYFRGVSHLVNPKFFKDLGFSVRKPDEDTESEVRRRASEDLVRIYGTGRKDNPQVGKMFEFWATREQMISAIPKLQERLNRAHGRTVKQHQMS